MTTLRTLALVAPLVLFPLFVNAQDCTSFDQCRGAGMCQEGECVSDPVTGGSCDDGSDCTTNDTCSNGECVGTPVESGSCNSGCGNCMVGFCVPDIERNGQPCTDAFGPCTTNDRCQFGFCAGTVVMCPDVDENRCTADFCDPTTGNCTVVPGDFICGDCADCMPPSGECVPRDDGNACEDFNSCTGAGSCADGECEPGDPTGPLLCVADCGDSMVSSADLQVAVEIGLRREELGDCSDADSGMDGSVTVEEIVQGTRGKIATCV